VVGIPAVLDCADAINDLPGLIEFKRQLCQVVEIAVWMRAHHKRNLWCGEPDHSHGITRSRRKPRRRLCRPPSSLGRSDRLLALLLSSLFACSETLLARFLVASRAVWDLLLCAKHLFVAAIGVAIAPAAVQTNARDAMANCPTRV